MGPSQAVGIIHRREIAAADEPDFARDQLAREYAEEHLSARAAAERGFIDEVIPPSQTRGRVADALASLETGLRTAPQHTNIPL
jgi:acetyl-CoA carboxylase carboxyltransferase component